MFADSVVVTVIAGERRVQITRQLGESLGREDAANLRKVAQHPYVSSLRMSRLIPVNFLWNRKADAIGNYRLRHSMRRRSHENTR